MARGDGNGSHEQILYGHTPLPRKPRSSPYDEILWSRRSRAELKVWFKVTDPAALYEYAIARYEDATGDPDTDWRPRDYGEAVLEAVLLSNENPPAADYGVEIGFNNYAALDGADEGVVELIVDVDIVDPKRLRDYSCQRRRYCLGEDDWVPADPAEACLEALVLSNENPDFSHYGLRLIGSESKQHPPADTSPS